MLPGRITAARYYRRRREERDLRPTLFESSSIGDLAMLLLIFFIVTSSFLLRQGLFLSLPSKSAGATKVETKQLLKIFPTADGYKLDEFDFTREELLKEIAERKENAAADEELVALIFMNKEVRYDRLVDALSLIRESEVRKVSVRSAENGAGKAGQGK